MTSKINTATMVGSSTGFKIGAWVATIFLLLVAKSMPNIMAQFASVFQNFGARLPVVTQLFLNAGYLWWLLFVPTLVISTTVTAQDQFQATTYDVIQTIFTILVCISIGLIITCVGAMYYPIYDLGKVV